MTLDQIMKEAEQSFKDTVEYKILIKDGKIYRRDRTGKVVSKKFILDSYKDSYL
jgi:hypothetical protein